MKQRKVHNQVKSIFFTSIIFVLCAPAQPSGRPGQRMIVTIDGLRDAVGQAMIFVFNNADDFPTKRDRAVAAKKVPVISSSMSIVFDEMPAGTYGVAVYHDENMNDKMDRSWYGMPEEGYGASNDSRGTFGPPKFSDARFEFTGPQDTVRIVIHY
jgi:uncharacterized protein (DUF2141 family)